MKAIIGIALWALIPGFIAKKKGRSFWGYYFLSFLITPLITMIITVCLKNISGELNQSIVNSEIETSAASDTFVSNSESDTTTPTLLPSNLPLEKGPISEPVEQTPITRKIQFCRRCGAKLIDDSEFCSNCGNKIESEEQ